VVLLRVLGGHDPDPQKAASRSAAVPKLPSW
jgi:hypothetical protein